MLLYNISMSREILNEDLKLKDLPENVTPLNIFWSFCHTFNGYEAFNGMDCGLMANAALQTWEKERRLPQDLSELRGCLFFEARRWRHYGYDPDPQTLVYLKELLEAVPQILTEKGSGV